MSEETRRGGLVGPVILIGLGVIFLLNNMGILAWSIWDAILRLWPLLLVAVGVDLLIGRRTIWGSLLALILILVVFAGGFMLLDVQSGSQLPVEEVSHALRGAKEAEVVLSPSVGQMRIGALDQDSVDLIAGEIRLYSGERIETEYNEDRDPVLLRLRSAGEVLFPAVGVWGKEWTWDLSLNPEVPVKMGIDLGLGKIDLGLTRLILTDLDVNLGMGQTRITLPSEGRFRVRISGGLGETILVVPEGMAARIQLSTGMVNRQMPGDYSRQGDRYTSPGYETAENRVDVEIDHAMGVVRVE
jgi:hypothetical protein